MVGGFVVEGFCRNDSYYVRFNDNDLMVLEKYADDLGYILEPERLVTDFAYPMRFKVWNSLNTELYGWISKTVEKVNGQWTPNILYGFYKQGRYYNKYSILSNLDASQVRSMYRHKAWKAIVEGCDDRFNKYLNTLRVVFGIIDLEKDITCSFAI